MGNHRRTGTGAKPVEYLFKLPPGARIQRAVFEAEVAGDYRISVRQKHDFLNIGGKEPVTEERFWPTAANPKVRNQGSPRYPFDFKPAEAEPHFTLAWAPGRPGLEDITSVRFNYGIPSGQTLLGADFRIDAVELVSRGEVVYNLREHAFPFASDSLDIKGKRFHTGSWAYAFMLKRPFQIKGYSIELGGELFRVDPGYSGGYDSRRGGTVYFTDQGGRKANEAVTQEFPLMEDNDDDDEWADDSISEETRFQPLVPGYYSG